MHLCIILIALVRVELNDYRVKRAIGEAAKRGASSLSLEELGILNLSADIATLAYFSLVCPRISIHDRYLIFLLEER